MHIIRLVLLIHLCNQLCNKQNIRLNIITRINSESKYLSISLTERKQPATT